MTLNPQTKREIFEIVRAALVEINGVSEIRRRPHLTPESIAEDLGVDVQTVRKMCKTGELRAKRIGKFYRIEQKDYDDYLKTCDLAA